MTLKTVETRFKSLAEKIGQVTSMVKEVIKGEPPDLLKMNFKANLIIDDKKFCFVMSQEDSTFQIGHDKFAELRIIASANFWNDVFDGTYTFFGGYAQGMVKIPKYRANRYKIFILSGLISMLLNMKMKL